MADELRIDRSVDLSGKLAVVTGANTGIGLVTARELARAGAHVVLACRDQDKAAAARAEIARAVPGASLELLPLDLSSIETSRAAARSLIDTGRTIDLLINNAGQAGLRGLTDDGFELTFGINHIGHFAWTEVLRPAVADGGRIVIVASKAHYQAKALDFDALRQPTRTTTGIREYNVSKLANVLHAQALAAELRPRHITVASLHPGVVASDIWRRVPWMFRGLIKLFMVTTEEGARTTVHCATAPDVETGLYWDQSTPRTPSRLARDTALQKALWERSLEWIGA